MPKDRESHVNALARITYHEVQAIRREMVTKTGLRKELRASENRILRAIKAWSAKATSRS